MSDKTMSNAELEFTQKLQMNFPRGILSVEVLRRWNGCPAEVIRAKCIEAFGQFPEPESDPLLDWLGIVNIPATTEKFVAREKFVVDTSKKAKVKISYLGDNLTEWFLSGDGKIESPISERSLRYGKLMENSVDAPIIAELGGEQKAEMTLAEMFALMEKQPNGERGTLLTNGWANIFYIRDVKGVLRAVNGCWYGDGWLVLAYSVLFPRRWCGGRLVFSRNSSVA